jgi:SSS family solute:Na+ symporter
MPRFGLDPIDWTLIGLYALFIVGKGMWWARKHRGALDYFLAGRAMTWPLIGASLYASNLSSTTLVGLAGAAYGTGISVYNYEWMAAVVLVVFAVFFIPIYLRSKVYTMPEFLGRRYDRRSRTYFAILTLVGNIIVDTAGTLYAGGLVLQIVFPDVPMWETIAIMAVLAGLYTIAGGLVAVIYTDAVQAVLLTVGAIVVAVKAFMAIGSWDTVLAATPPEMLSLVRPLDDEFLPWLGLLTGVPLLGFYFWCTNQFMVQRVLSARSVHHGRLGALFAGLLKLPVLWIMVLPGTMARVLYPRLENPDLVYPTLIFDLLPAGLLGLVVAGFLAALMSQIDSTLNSAATLVTMDFVRVRRPSLDDRQLMWVGRATTAVFMVFAATWATRIEQFGSLFHYLQNVLSYIAPPVVAVFLLGVFWRRATAQGAFASLMTGLVLGVGLLVLNLTVWEQGLHFLYVGTVLFLICTMVHVGVSLATPAPQLDQVAPLTWSRQQFHIESEELRQVRWYANYRVLSVALLILTAAVVIANW